MHSKLLSESHNRGAWRESKWHHPFFRSLLEGMLDIAALVAELKAILDGIRFLSFRQIFSGLSKACRSHPFHRVVGRQIIHPPYVPDNSPRHTPTARIVMLHKNVRRTCCVNAAESDP